MRYWSFDLLYSTILLRRLQSRPMHASVRTVFSLTSEASIRCRTMSWQVVVSLLQFCVMPTTRPSESIPESYMLLVSTSQAIQSTSLSFVSLAKV